MRIIIAILIFTTLLSCDNRYLTKEYSVDSMDKTIVQLFSDSTYVKQHHNKEETGEWGFISEVDSIIELKKDSNVNESLNQKEYFYAHNDTLDQLIPFKCEETFSWIMINKSGPEWIKQKSHGGSEFSKVREKVHLISSVDSLILSYESFNGESITVKGYYFQEQKKGMSKGCKEFSAKSFLVIEENERASPKVIDSQ